MAWKNDRQRHSLSKRGIHTARGFKKLKYPQKITQLPFDYEKAGYDLNTLLLIPEHREMKRHMIYDVNEYIDYLKGKSEFGRDETIYIYFKEYKDPVRFEMDTYDVETKKITGWKPSGKEIIKNFNPNITTHVAEIKNIIKIDAYGTYDFYGELIHDYELKRFDMTPLRAAFYDFYKDKNALRLKDNKWVKIVSPHEVEIIE